MSLLLPSSLMREESAEVSPLCAYREIPLADEVALAAAVVLGLLAPAAVAPVAAVLVAVVLVALVFAAAAVAAAVAAGPPSSAALVVADAAVVLGILVVVTGSGVVTVELPLSERPAWRRAPNKSCKKACRS